MGDEFEDVALDSGSDMNDSTDSYDPISLDAGDNTVEDIGCKGLEDSDYGNALDSTEEALDMGTDTYPCEGDSLPDTDDSAANVDTPADNAGDTTHDDATNMPEEVEPIESTYASSGKNNDTVDDHSQNAHDTDAPGEEADAPMDENLEALDEGIENLPDDEDAACPANDDGTDWDRTSLTPEQEAQLREMGENGDVDIPSENPDWQEPERKDVHLPTDKTGSFEGERGNSAFHPNNQTALDKIGEYGRDSVDYHDGHPDFSPFTQHDTPYGTINGQVEIPHMTASRANPSWDYGRRPAGTKHDPHYDLGNFSQADIALSNDLKTMTPAQVEAFRKDNGLVWHECPDGKTMQLVPAEIHDACRHSGGVSEQKYRQAMGDITAPTS